MIGLYRTRPADYLGAVAAFDFTLLKRMYTGQYGDRGVIYSDWTPDPQTRAQLISLGSLGLVEFRDASTMSGWDETMWGARLTAVGVNAVYRNGGKARGRFVDGIFQCLCGWSHDDPNPGWP